MNRGVLTFTKEELNLIFNEMTLNLTQTPLYQHLVLLKQSNDLELKLQVNEEEVEQILDNIGFPIDSESDAKKSLRLKLQKFLSTIREN